MDSLVSEYKLSKWLWFIYSHWTLKIEIIKSSIWWRLILLDRFPSLLTELRRYNVLPLCTLAWMDCLGQFLCLFRRGPCWQVFFNEPLFWWCGKLILESIHTWKECRFGWNNWDQSHQHQMKYEKESFLWDLNTP